VIRYSATGPEILYCDGYGPVYSWLPCSLIVLVYWLHCDSTGVFVLQIRCCCILEFNSTYGNSIYCCYICSIPVMQSLFWMESLFLSFWFIWISSLLQWFVRLLLLGTVIWWIYSDRWLENSIVGTTIIPFDYDCSFLVILSPEWYLQWPHLLLLCWWWLTRTISDYIPRLLFPVIPVPTFVIIPTRYNSTSSRYSMNWWFDGGDPDTLPADDFSGVKVCRCLFIRWRLVLPYGDYLPHYHCPWNTMVVWWLRLQFWALIRYSSWVEFHDEHLFWPVPVVYRECYSCRPCPILRLITVVC